MDKSVKKYEAIHPGPLTYEYDEVGFEVQTPAHLIYGRRLMNIPDEDLENDISEGKLDSGI